MDIDFYNVKDKNRNNVLFSIDESFFTKNYDSLKSFGIEVDVYGTTLLSNDKIKLLLDFLSEDEFFVIFLKESYKKGESLIIEGN